MDIQAHEAAMAINEKNNGEFSLRNYMYKGYVEGMLNMWCRTSGFGESLFMTFRYENFQDFVEQKEMFLKPLMLCSPNGIIIALARQYCIEQMESMLCDVNHVRDISEIENYEAVVYEINRAIELNKDELLEKVKVWHPDIYRKYGGQN
ncbi:MULTISPECIES: hypothetical protein [Burkholderia]|uniref:hypothetical protein n=1 Tax=Burkholderia TaxID=32008 RepID=UPI0005DFEFFD|nr:MULTISPECIES: hypothetical protein [Burkholderia]MDO5943304.1 hypothetical protein [Burkholderia cepacia]CAK1331857.1 Uncharacterised protein [Burkholderia pseudomallei]